MSGVGRDRGGNEVGGVVVVVQSTDGRGFEWIEQEGDCESTFTVLAAAGAGVEPCWERRSGEPRCGFIGFLHPPFLLLLFPPLDITVVDRESVQELCG